MAFNENSRVKLPALVHLCKLGYNYISEKKLRLVCDQDTNINVEVFKNKLPQFNPLLKPIEIDQFLISSKLHWITMIWEGSFTRLFRPIQEFRLQTSPSRLAVADADERAGYGWRKSKGFLQGRGRIGNGGRAGRGKIA